MRRGNASFGHSIPHARRWAAAAASLAAVLAAASSAEAGGCGIAAAVPERVPTSGGVSVDLFLDGAPSAVVQVRWDGAPVPIELATAAHVRIVAPAGDGTPALTLEYADGTSCTTSGPVAYVEPFIADIAPMDAFPGDAITLTGTNFGPNPAVLVDGVEVALASPPTHDVCVFNAPAGVFGERTVEVVAGGQHSNTVTLNVIEPVFITSWIAPRRSTAGGDIIIIQGRGFGSSPIVAFGPVNVNPLVATNTQLIAQIPPSQGLNIPLTVYNGETLDSDSLIGGFSYSPPEIRGVTPAQIPAGSPGTLTLYGANFGLTAEVSVNGAPAAVSVQSHDRLVITHPALSVGPAQIVVAVGGQIAFAPSVEVFAPCVGDTNGDGVVNFADLNNVLSSFGAMCQSMLR